MEEFVNWSGLIARLDDRTKDGRVLTGLSDERLPVPLFASGADVIGRVDSLEIVDGAVLARGKTNSAFATPNVAIEVIDFTQMDETEEVMYVAGALASVRLNSAPSWDGLWVESE